MRLAFIDSDVFVPFLVFSIPIIAIVGGITAGIVRTIGQQRLAELAQRERIAAIERGIDPSKLAPPPAIASDEGPNAWDLGGSAKRRAQGLLIGGLICTFVGVGLGVFLSLIEPHENVWAVGIIPASAGIALLLSALIVNPRGSSNPRP